MGRASTPRRCTNLGALSGRRRDAACEQLTFCFAQLWRAPLSQPAAATSLTQDCRRPCLEATRRAGDGRRQPSIRRGQRMRAVARLGSAASRSAGAPGWLPRRGRGRRRVRLQNDCAHGRANADSPAHSYRPCRKDGGGRTPARRCCRSASLWHRSSSSRARHARAPHVEPRERSARLELRQLRRAAWHTELWRRAP
jgi:hypothetical protein